MATALKGSTAVVTGASSGIGRATAKRLAGQGVNLVLVARNGEALRELASQVGEDQVAVVTADVADEDAVERAAAHAIERFGSLDVWVNNAAVTLFGRFEETPPRDWRRVIETNLFGYVHGARAAIRRFREQGHGVLINVSSQVARAPIPYVSAYITSKAGIDGLTTSLREEMLLDDAPIHICTVMPPSVDTPLFQHAANYTGRAVKPMDPIYDADAVARAIVSVARRPRPEVIVGGTRIGVALPRLLPPRQYARQAARKADRDHFQEAYAPPDQGNLYHPDLRLHRIDGGWRTPARQLWLTGAAVAASSMLALGLLRARALGGA